MCLINLEVLVHRKALRYIAYILFPTFWAKVIELKMEKGIY